jgi:hypothetical protein
MLSVGVVDREDCFPFRPWPAVQMLRYGVGLWIPSLQSLSPNVHYLFLCGLSCRTTADAQLKVYLGLARARECACDGVCERMTRVKRSDGEEYRRQETLGVSDRLCCCRW